MSEIQISHLEHDALKQQLRQTEALLNQEKGKVLALERDIYETKRQAKLAVEGANALKAETEAALLTASQSMQVAHSVSMGIYAFSMMGRAYMARKVAAARVVHREQTYCVVLQQFLDGTEKGDSIAIQTAKDKAKAIIASVKADGEAMRLSAIEASLAYGFTEFEKVFERLTTENNQTLKAVV